MTESTRNIEEEAAMLTMRAKAIGEKNAKQAPLTPTTPWNSHWRRLSSTTVRMKSGSKVGSTPGTGRSVVMSKTQN